MTRFYFAYGSNMDPAQMALRCPRACPLGRGRIRHRRFLINSRGVATISPERDVKTWGGVWAISAADEAALDRFEGFPHRYDKRHLWVRLDDGTRIKALVYIDPVADEGWPRPGYLPRILRGASHFRLPAGYVTQIAAPFFQDEELPIAC